jgi:spore maturation protein CgeB
MNILCVFGQYAYGDSTRGEGYEYVNFIPALRRLGHRVTLFDSLDRRVNPDFAALNRALLERVEAIKPDVVFCVLMQYEIWVETLRLIRKSGAFLVNWATDDSWKYEMFSKLIAPEFDLYVTTYSSVLRRYQKDGIGNVVLSQWAANSDTLAPPLPARECCYPVSFIGAAYGNRPDIIDSLSREGIDVACFGYGWPEGPIDAKRIPEIVRMSAISLNFSEGSQKGLVEAGNRQIKARLFEVPGYGGCLLTEETPDLEKYFRVGEEVLTFSDPDDLAATIKALLVYPDRRNAIARRGFERVRVEHTYDQRFAQLLSEVAKQKARPSFPVDWSEYGEVVKRHKYGPVLKFMRAVLAGCASMIWGGRRGPRAARRLIFELSWRLAGARTYAAAGWPGRMFYKES